MVILGNGSLRVGTLLKKNEFQFSRFHVFLGGDFFLIKVFRKNIFMFAKIFYVFYFKSDTGVPSCHAARAPGPPGRLASLVVPRLRAYLT